MKIVKKQFLQVGLAASSLSQIAARSLGMMLIL